MKKREITKEDLEHGKRIMKLDPTFKAFKAVAFEVFNKRFKELNKDNKVYVKVIKETAKLPAMYIEVKDTKKFIKNYKA